MTDVGPRVTAARALPREVDAVVVPACSDQLGDAADGADWEYLRARGFEGRTDQVVTLPGSRAGATVVMVGLGPAGAVDASVIRRAAAVSTRACLRHRLVATHLLDALPGGASAAQRTAAAAALAEGAVLGAYRFTRYKTSPDPAPLEEVVVVGRGAGARALERGVRVGEAVTLARDLVNEPGGSLTPAALAQAAVEMAEREGLQVTVLDEDDIADAGLGGLLGVNRGSLHPPRLVQLRYEPERPRGSVALVGKGITFDSGGLSLKTGAGMMTMKSDMAGAAAVIGAFSAMRAVAPRVVVTGWLPLTDNMTGADATRPGDVLRTRNGRTVEVLNTDAEGRLVLADALALASEDGPDAIVDLATLTGAVDTALGKGIAGLLGNDEGWIEQVRAAAATAGERVWQLPMPDDYRRNLDSDVADLRNITRLGPSAGTIHAALFLREFVGEGIPWVHLDIAATAWSDEVAGESVKGGTGFGVRTLLALVRDFRRPRSGRPRSARDTAAGRAAS